jgi:hypothetical protein
MTKVEPLILQFANNQYARAFDEQWRPIPLELLPLDAADRLCANTTFPLWRKHVLCILERQ